MYLKICFAPSTNDIISLFKDDTIYVWSTNECVSLKCQFTPYDVEKNVKEKENKLNLPEANNQNEQNDNDEEKNLVLKQFYYKCFSVSR